MTVSPPKVNGRTWPPAIPVLEDWQSLDTATTRQPETGVTPASQPEPVEKSDAVAEAEAEAIRARAWAEAEERRIKAEAEKEAALKRAEAEAEAIRVKAEADAEKQRLANARAERKAAEEQAASEARIAEHQRRRDEAERARAEADRQAAAQQRAKQAVAKEIEAADEKWRAYAIRFAIVCGIVSLPVQMSFFWNPKAPWMAAAPIMLEGAAWVVHRGARAAAVSKRPVWHYRTIVWFLAFVAAGVNLYHGLHSFDPGTAVATAFASIAGPGVWDLHEHGRIRKRDGKPSWREWKAQRKTEQAEAARKAAEEEQRAAEKAAAEEAAEEARQELIGERQREFPEVWAEAVRIGAALGKVPDDPAVWPRAYRNIKGCEPGDSIESITSRRKAEARVESALSGTPVNTLSKTTNAQRASQMPPARKQRVYNPPARPGRRTKGDTAPYVSAARKQASITARNAAKNTRPNAS